VSEQEDPARLAVTRYGLRIGIQCDDARMLAEVIRRLPPGAEDAGSPAVDRTYSVHRLDPGAARGAEALVLRVDGVSLVESAEVERVSEALVEDLELYVAEMARQWVFIHAGVVGWRGHALLLPGRSWSGKTRLVVELLRAGAEYYSDEFAVLDPAGRVHPYPRALSIRQQDGARRERCTAEALRGRSGEGPMPVGLVAVSHYEPGARWAPHALSAGQAVLALLAHSVSVRRQPAVVLDTLARVAAEAVAVTGVRGEAADVVESLLSMVRV
jgi:hypothetical protein